MQNNQTQLKDFQIISKLGQGSFSQVFQVKRKSDNQIYAMKQVKMFQLNPKDRENALNEVRILASINDSNIVNYKEAFIDDQQQLLCIVMEFAQSGDLQNKITTHRNQKTNFLETEIWKAAYDLAKGLNVLHKMNILHRDLKSANIFLTKNNNNKTLYKIGDLNVAKIAKQGGFVYTQTGTPYYASPEVWRDEPYDHKSDIWSLGCVLYEMCALRPPFRANDMEGLFKKVQLGLYERIPMKYSNDLSCFLASLLKVNPQQRPSCEQILRNALIQKYMGVYQDENKSINEKLPFQKQELLQTIILPKNLQQLKGKLPKANYMKSTNFVEEKFTQEQQNKQRFNRQILSAGNNKNVLVLPQNRNLIQKNVALPKIMQRPASGIVPPATKILNENGIQKRPFSGKPLNRQLILNNPYKFVAEKYEFKQPIILNKENLAPKQQLSKQIMYKNNSEKQNLGSRPPIRVQSSRVIQQNNIKSKGPLVNNNQIYNMMMNNKKAYGKI